MIRPRFPIAIRAIAATFVVLILAAATFVVVPPSAATLAPSAVPGVTLTDRAGAVLRTARAADGSRLRWVSLAEIEPSLIAAFVATEDRGFYSHHGIEPRALARAFRDNLLAGRIVSGASTITMQTARLVAGLPRGWRGKPAQLLWALRLESHLSKEAILEQYLNRVPLGQGTVGVEAAAQLYFGTSAANVSLGQSAMLAGLARAPSRDNPISSPTRAEARRALALRRLAARGYTTPHEFARANAEPVRITSTVAAPAPDSGAREPFPAPHFTSWVLSRRSDDLTPTAGMSDTRTRRRTTLDLALQHEIEGEVQHAVQHLADEQVEHAAAVVLDNRTGDVLAWVGSPDFNGASGQVDMVVSRRQPGSALKPFVYALGFDRGITAATVLDDISHTWQTPSGPYRPRNYDRREHGPVRAREALASSYNIPAVQLADRLGIPAVLRTLRTAGFASLSQSPEHYGLGLALGDGDVTLLELANAYRALGNGGVWSPVRMDADAVPSDSSRRVVSAGAAALVLDILADPAARLPGFGESTPFDFAFPTAVKTGTSRHFTDNWAAAVTGGFTVAVWVGNFDGHPMAAVSGISGAGPLLRRIVLRTAARYPAQVLTTPASVQAQQRRVCRVSGMVATNACPAIDEWFLPGTAPTQRDTWYRDGALVLPARFASWRMRARTGLGDGAPVATGTSVAEGRTPAIPVLVMDSPRDGDRYQLPTGAEASVATIALRATGRDATLPVTWWVDGQPYRQSRWKLVRGEHRIAAASASGVRVQARIIVE